MSNMVDRKLVLIRDVIYFVLFSILLILLFEFIKVTFLLSSLFLSFTERNKSMRCYIKCRRPVIILCQVEVS